MPALDCNELFGTTIGTTVAARCRARSMPCGATDPRAWTYLRGPITGDWGELERADVAENALWLREGFRLLSAYALPDGTRLWIITDADPSATTLLLPEEY